ncbi:hypothetical protein ACWFQ8_13475 [Streptomyces sp. NPDC055254]
MTAAGIRLGASPVFPAAAHGRPAPHDTGAAGGGRRAVGGGRRAAGGRDGDGDGDGLDMV